jgi:hypothetical protein
VTPTSSYLRGAILDVLVMINQAVPLRKTGRLTNPRSRIPLQAMLGTLSAHTMQENQR